MDRSEMEGAKGKVCWFLQLSKFGKIKYKTWRERKKENRSVPLCTSFNHSIHVLFAIDILLVISPESTNNTRVCDTVLLLLFLEEFGL